jgi:hypothetical protein
MMLSICMQTGAARIAPVVAPAMPGIVHANGACGAAVRYLSGNRRAQLGC